MARDGGDVYAQAIDPEQASPGIPARCSTTSNAGGTALKKIGAIDFRDHHRPWPARCPDHREDRGGGAATEKGKYAWDAVVMDAPPTGRITRFLNVNTEVADPHEGRADPQPGRFDHAGHPIPRDGCSSGHAAGGDAGAGDAGRLWRN